MLTSSGIDPLLSVERGPSQCRLSATGHRTSPTAHVLALAFLALATAAGCGASTAPPQPTSTPEPIVPTRTPTPAASAVPTTAQPTATGEITDFDVEQLRLGWYLNGGVREQPARPPGAEFWQMVRVSDEGYRPNATVIRMATAANPGSFWIIGNEPNGRKLYHELCQLLKAADPLSELVVGGVSQPTPFRLVDRELIVESHQERCGEPMPVDVWNVYGLILREERDACGVDIPPWMDTDVGTLDENVNHDVAIFGCQILEFRRWMADQWQREKPSVVSECGTLMPEDYGFGPAELRAFFDGSCDFFLTATDDEVGYPNDGNRLVQWWGWYSLVASEDYYPMGDPFHSQAKEMTPLGAAFAAYSAP